MIPLYHLTTFGCQMNKSDSERVETVLQAMGFAPTEERDQADLILINTCSVRQSAEDRVFGLAREFAVLKEKNPRLIIGVTGCMAGRDVQGKLKEKMPTADLFFPISDLAQLPRWIAELRPEFVNSEDFPADYLKIQPKYSSTFQAYIPIQSGCNKFCSYCVVPFSRGREYNRSVREILDEIRALAEKGCVEVTLLGQTVNSYKAPDAETFSPFNPYRNSFAALLWEINQISGILRLHFTAPHPVHMDDEVIDALALPAHVNYLHLPVQAGDDEVLRRMNRRYTREQYLDIICRLRKRLPSIAVGTDIIVGFCGETEEQFERTVDLYKEVGFDISYTAVYSPRSGTLAAKAFPDDVSRAEKRRRWNVLQELMERIVLEKNQAYVGRTVSVLVEQFLSSPSGAEKGLCTGHSRETKVVQFPGDRSFVGTIQDVRIRHAKEWVLTGERV
ncbi:MAG TPA: tRNA (N6-isopentenyl adenosine(37)-C2)-methylthiotransferase MiaB [Patescibacteria group bacterium]|nr:tRNA (N6-isopentenyl adenosine(37)-C2)-methylthiotransferase MiaB [Patescibacteria group bacterium]